jgi:hypothetical protein
MRLVASLLVCLVFAGCSDDSSDDDGEEKSEAQLICEDICELVDAAACENADTPCVQSCLHNAEPCPTEAKAWLDCHPTIGCNQDGRPVSTSCDAEWQAYGDCAPG